MQKAFYRYALAMGSTLSVFVFRYKYFLSPATHAVDDTTIVKLRYMRG